MSSLLRQRLSQSLACHPGIHTPNIHSNLSRSYSASEALHPRSPGSSSSHEQEWHTSPSASSYASNGHKPLIHPRGQPSGSSADLASGLTGPYLSPTFQFTPNPVLRNSDADPRQSPSLSDHEWELRFGRAVNTLQTTLPTFFSTGLITRPHSSFEATKFTPSSPDEDPIGTDPFIDRLPAILKGKEKEDADEAADEQESIYSPRIRLSYTPPTALPPPFPRTLTVEGLPLYLASAVFVRHTLQALYTDLALDLRAVRVLPSASAPRPAARDKALYIRFGVTGHARVGGGPVEWEVASTYAFSPRTALVERHTVNSIHPAPHARVYDLLRATLARLRGQGEPGAIGGVGGVGMCRASEGR